MDQSVQTEGLFYNMPQHSNKVHSSVCRWLCVQVVIKVFAVLTVACMKTNSTDNKKQRVDMIPRIKQVILLLWGQIVQICKCYPSSNRSPYFSCSAIVTGKAPLEEHSHNYSGVTTVQKSSSMFVLCVTSLQEATARWRGVNHLLSLALTLAPWMSRGNENVRYVINANL